MKLRLLPRLLLFILTPALVGLCVVAALSYRKAENALELQINEELTLLVERQQSELNNVTGLLRSVLENDAQVGREVWTYLEAAGREEDSARMKALRERALATLEATARTFPRIREAALLDAGGRVLVHTNPDLVGRNFGENAYFRQAMEGRNATQDIIGVKNQERTTTMSVPVKGKDGRVLGVLYGNLDIDALSKTTTNTIKVGRTGICFVYNDNGTLIIHPNRNYIGDEDGKLGWVRQILTERNGRLDYVWDGRDKVAYFREVPDMNWHVVIAVERDDLMAPVTNMFHNSLIVVAIGALAVGLIIFLVARNIAGTLRGEALVVGQVAAGNLTLDPDMRRGLDSAGARSDEIGALARGIGRMVENIRGLFEEARQKTDEAEKATAEAREAMAEAEEARKAAENARREGMLAAAGQLEEVVAVVSSASTELSARIEQSERGAAEQAARASETATAMEEMNSTVIEVARNAGAASEVSARTREKAEEGEGIVEKAVDAIRQVQRESLSLKEDMAALNEHAHAISRIMGVISDIADQTNLLALNAAIEAARAGEAGRGFAVVADEVRKLAEKTMVSTADVAGAIRAIQDSADKSAAQVDKAVAAVEEATGHAYASGAALREIVSMADGTADQVRAIATASEEQSASSEEINRSVTQVNAIADETARAMQEASRAVSDLAAQAQKLNALVDELKRA